MTMGLEPMHPMDWIEIDEHYDEEMALRRKLMKEKRDIVLHSLPGVGSAFPSMDACRQVQTVLAEMITSIRSKQLLQVAG